MYEAEVSRRNPTAFLFLVDQSGSMAEDFGGAANTSKADFVATVINRQLFDLTLRATKDDGVRDYFHVGLIGYGETIGSALPTSQPGVLTPISSIAASPLRLDERTRKVPDGAGGLVEETIRFPVWVDAVASGGTPMSEAIHQTQDLLADWIDAHPDSFPPTVINITDGQATDGDPRVAAESLRSLASRDGALLFYNVHIAKSSFLPIQWPSTSESLPDEFARVLYDMSSLLPPFVLAAASTPEQPVRDGARAFMYNADPVALTQFVEIGTRVLLLR